MFATPAIAQNWAGAGDRIRVAVVGVRGRGRSHIASLHELANKLLTRPYRKPFVVPEEV